MEKTAGTEANVCLGEAIHLGALRIRLRGVKCMWLGHKLILMKAAGSSTAPDLNSWNYVVRVTQMLHFNSLTPRQNGRHFADDIFKCIFLTENVWILLKISLKIVPKGPINNILALAKIMAWCRPGDKPLSEPMMVSLPTHICVTRPQWVNMSRRVQYVDILQTTYYDLWIYSHDLFLISNVIRRKYEPTDWRKDNISSGNGLWPSSQRPSTWNNVDHAHDAIRFHQTRICQTPPSYFSEWSKLVRAFLGLYHTRVAYIFAYTPAYWFSRWLKNVWK